MEATITTQSLPWKRNSECTRRVLLQGQTLARSLLLIIYLKFYEQTNIRPLYP